jgi:hypothetical protein
MVHQQEGRCSVADVANSQADHLRREAPAHAESEKIIILRDQKIAIQSGPILDHKFIRTSEPDQAYMS